MKAEFGEAQQEAETAEANPNEKLMTGRQKWTLIVFALTFVVMIVGFIPWGDFGVEVFDAGAATEEVTTQVSGDDISAAWTDKKVGGEITFDGDVTGTVTAEEEISQGWSAFLTGLPLGQWYFDEASTWFLIMAIIIGIVGGVSESRFVKAFINGTADMMSVVLIIAMARSITVLMGETGLDMWILNNAANALNGLSAVIFAPMSFLLYIVLSFLIPSSSGMATVSMPIMGPLANSLGFSPDVMIMIFSAGNGLVNLFTPTSGAIRATSVIPPGMEERMAVAVSTGATRQIKSPVPMLMMTMPKKSSRAGFNTVRSSRTSSRPIRCPIKPPTRACTAVFTTLGNQPCPVRI